MAGKESIRTCHTFVWQKNKPPARQVEGVALEGIVFLNCGQCQK